VNNRRRHYWINPRFQGRYVAMIFGLELIAVVASALFSFGIALVLLNPSFEVGPAWNQIIAGFVIVAVLVAVALGWLGVRVSHRICGPEYRIRDSLRRIRQGEPVGPIRLRNHDQLQDLADDLNLTLAHLRVPGFAVPDSQSGKAWIAARD